MVPAPQPGDDGRCDNCDAELVGPFCHQCGQRDVDHLASIRAFVAHLAELLVSFDSRLLRTVKALFLRPGFLSAEYIAGRRVRYVPPVQVYLVSAALLFLAASFKPMVAFNPATRAFSSAISTVTVRDTLLAADAARLRARGIPLEVFAERFSNETTSRLSSFLVLLVPMFALVVAATFALRPRPLSHHVLFALHWTAFYLAMLAVLQPLPVRRLPPALIMIVLLGGPFAYLLGALRRVYRTGWVSTLARGAIIYAAFIMMLGGWLELVTQYTIRHL